MIVMSVGLPLLTVFSPSMSAQSLAFRIFYVVFVTAIMLCVMAAFQVVMMFLWMIANKNRGVLGVHEMEIRDDGLLERTSVNESLHRWSGFHKLGSTRNFLFVFVTDNIVYYVPWKAFASEQDAKYFRDEIQRRAQAA
jgi:hypothetical protein